MGFFTARYIACSLVSFLALAGLATPAYGRAGISTDMAGRHVAAVLVRAEDLSPADWPDEAVNLAVNTDLVNAQTNVYSLLQTNGIAPDTEAFTIVYDLNPTLRDVKTLESGTTLKLPRIVGGPKLRELLKHGYLVMLTVDPILREKLNHSAEILQTRLAAFAKLPADRFDSTRAAEAQKEIASLGRWYAEVERSFLRRTGPPLRRQSLVQLQSEAERIDSVLQNAIDSNRKLSMADIDLIAAVHDDVEVEMEKYGQVLANEAPSADGLYTVIVRIIADDPRLVEKSRVYYTNYGLYHEPPGEESNPFRNPGSGASELLRVQNYMIWAARDGDPSHPLTKLLVKVRPWNGEPIVVTLTLR